MNAPMRCCRVCTRPTNPADDSSRRWRRAVAGSSLYHDDDAGGITDINVTPFVDVVLVLLVVFIVTAKLIVARGVEIDKPKASTGAEVQSTLRVSIKARKDPAGHIIGADLFVNADRFDTDAQAIARIKEIAATST